MYGRGGGGGGGDGLFGGGRRGGGGGGSGFEIPNVDELFPTPDPRIPVVVEIKMKGKPKVRAARVGLWVRSGSVDGQGYGTEFTTQGEVDENDHEYIHTTVGTTFLVIEKPRAKIGQLKLRPVSSS